jgi:hypothetical protein
MTTDTKLAKKTALIDQMLKKAESTTPEEAEALLEAATKLMARYGVTEAMLVATGAKAKEEIGGTTVKIKGIYSRELMFMIYHVCRASGTTRILYSKWSDTDYRVTIYGYESDVKAMVALAESLLVQATHATAVWWRQHRAEYKWLAPFDQFVQRRTFVTGFGDGAAQKMREAMAVATAESDASGHTGTALVIRDRGKEVEEFINSKAGRSRSFNTRSGNYAAAAAGRAAGTRADINQRTINN